MEEELLEISSEVVDSTRVIKIVNETTIFTI